MSIEVSNEFSRPVPLDRISASWTHHSIEAEEAERIALATRFDLVAIDRLTAEVRLRRDRAGTQVAFLAHFSASVVQQCVVTLEPTPAEIDEELEIRFDLSAEILAAELDIDADEESVEPLEGDVIDIGEVIAQHLSLALDPFPRHPDAPPPLEEEPAVVEEAPEPVRPSPFAALAKRRTIMFCAVSLPR